MPLPANEMTITRYFKTCEEADRCIESYRNGVRRPEGHFVPTGSERGVSGPCVWYATVTLVARKDD